MRFLRIGNITTTIIGPLCMAVIGAQSTLAAEGPDAHALAEKFSTAHDQPAPRQANPLRPDEVEGAIQTRRFESDVKTTNDLLDSIEARTRAVEKLLEKTRPPSWDTTVTTQDDQEANSDGSFGGARVQDADEPGAALEQERRDLPEPTYALTGGAHMRAELHALSDVLDKATILLQLKPGTKGLRRFKKTADPVVCGRRHCYMSKGLSESAENMHRGAALGPFNTLGRRAGACRQKLSCAFRNVDLMKQGVLMQPVDLKLMRHDRRAYRQMRADTSCQVRAGRLHCSSPVIAKTWKAWIVPEAVAMEAGPDALKAALQDGLPDAPLPVLQAKRKTN